MLADARDIFVARFAPDLRRSAHDDAAARNLRSFGDERARRDDRPCTDARSVHHNRAHSNENFIFNYTTVQRHRMRHADPVAQNQRKLVALHVQTAVILHIRLVSDADEMHVTADSGVRPDAGPLADYHVTNYLSAGVDIGGRGDFRHDAAVATNRHAC